MVGQPIDTTGLTLDARDDLTLRAHDEVAKLLDEANSIVLITDPRWSPSLPW